MRNITKIVISAGVILAMLGMTFSGYAAVKKPLAKKTKVGINYSKVAVLAKQSSRALLKSRPTSVLMKQLSILSPRERRIHGYLTGIAFRRSLDQQPVSVSHLMTLAASLDLASEARARVIAGAANSEFGAVMDIYEASPQLQQLLSEDRLELLPGVREGIEMPDAPEMNLNTAIQQNHQLHQTIQNDIHDIANLIDEIYQSRVDDFEISTGGFADEALSEFETWLLDVLVGATIAGGEAQLTGGNFWEGFSEYVAQEVMDYVMTSLISWAESHEDDGGFLGAVATAFLWIADLAGFGGGDDNDEETGEKEKDDCFTKVEIPDWPTTGYPGPFGNPNPEGSGDDSGDGTSPWPFPWPFPMDADENWDDLQVNHGLSGLAAERIVQRHAAIDTLMLALLAQSYAKTY